MMQHNISAETILCSRCPAPTVPEARYNICKKREGFVPKTLRPILERRGYFKARILAGGEK
jgi:DNA polymerase-2